MKKMNRLMILLCLVLFLLSTAGSALASTKFVTIVTGSTGGTYYPIGTILANHFNAALMDKGYKWSAQSSGGTVENLDMMQRNEAEMAIAMANLTGFAYTGTVRYEGKKIENLRYVMGLWPDVTQFVVSGSSGIKTWADLKGKKVAVGPAASGTEFSSHVLLKALAGLTFDDIKAEYVGYSEAAQALQNGQLDAFNAEAGVPVAAVAELYAGRQEVNMLEFSPEDLAKVKKEAPFYAAVLIPAGTYPKQEKDLHVAGIKSALLVGKDVPEEIVYEMLKIIYNKEEDLKKEHAAFTKVDFKNPVDGLYGAPLHPGAVKFFREIGKEIPQELLP
ncbi:MAG: TAXI family TRAP transporter solute-binding subunit [Synergistaceae bacterium]|nr:TAXI family TRAP transporter solute-binding subunit [Synergistaceae bacterium]MDD3390632.1 TAXI family TRAP transporter solute-binding subunit [Synergistaceae bacterium]MDD3688600.1 TAXI family TRAP transporter solute-binding subunit [Synergistaceae bacterium]MDD4020714.1 TAXI family TRAP transporter solute-binding subunit [Synergistaceae bacterium]